MLSLDMLNTEESKHEGTEPLSQKLELHSNAFNCVSKQLHIVYTEKMSAPHTTPIASTSLASAGVPQGASSFSHSTIHVAFNVPKDAQPG